MHPKPPMANSMHYDAIINGASGSALGRRIAKIRDMITGGLGHQLGTLNVLTPSQALR
jgi:hypothetical protein